MKSSKVIPSLLSCQSLKEILRKPPRKIALLETDIGKQFEKEFQHAHLPRARYFDQLECTTPTKLIPRGLPEIKCFESYLSRLGVSNDDHIVLYDRSPMGFYASSRAWWLLKTLGVDQLSILNGGFYKWLKEIKEVEASEPSANESQSAMGNFKVQFNQSMLKTFDDILSVASGKTREEQIVDARPPNLFNGANAGHIRHSRNIPYTDVFDQSNQCLKSPEELRQLFKQTGIDLSKEAIYTCQTGTTASTLAFVADLLGQPSPSVYNGSFTEWQQRAPKELIVHQQSSSSNTAA